jgi:hypothetical protein
VHRTFLISENPEENINLVLFLPLFSKGHAWVPCNVKKE